MEGKNQENQETTIKMVFELIFINIKCKQPLILKYRDFSNEMKKQDPNSGCPQEIYFKNKGINWLKLIEKKYHTNPNLKKKLKLSY